MQKVKLFPTSAGVPVDDLINTYLDINPRWKVKSITPLRSGWVDEKVLVVFEMC